MGGAFVGLSLLNTFLIGMQVVNVNPYWINVFSGIYCSSRLLGLPGPATRQKTKVGVKEGILCKKEVLSNVCCIIKRCRFL
jgi:hypothetical protein